MDYISFISSLTAGLDTIVSLGQTAIVADTSATEKAAKTASVFFIQKGFRKYFL
jgi:hypothetical protein